MAVGYWSTATLDRYGHLPEVASGHINIVYINLDNFENFSELLRLMQLQDTLLIVDTETYNKKIFADNKYFDEYDSKGNPKELRFPRLISVYAPYVDVGTVYVIDLGLQDDIVPNELRDISNAFSKNTCVYHNAAFDLQVLAPRVLPSRIEDTLYLARQAFPYAESKGLAALAKGFKLDKYYDMNKYTLNYHLLDGIAFDKAELQSSNFGAEQLSAMQLVYSAADVIVTYEVFKMDVIQAARQKLSYKLDMQNQRYASFYQQNKLHTDTTLVYNQMTEDNTNIFDLQDRLYELLGKAINVNSSKQTTAVLNSLDKSITNSDKKALTTLALDGKTAYIRDVADTIYKLRRRLKSAQLLNSYKYGWVVSSYDVGGANTGRFTSKGKYIYRGVNTQQIPRAKRNIFIPSEGNVIVGADYPTIELRVIAALYPNLREALGKYNAVVFDKSLDKYWYHISEDTMYKYLINGIDLHRATAHSMTGIPIDEIDDETSFKAKAVNFGLGFGMGATAFQDYAYVGYNVKFTMQECQEIHSTYRSTYQEVDRAIEFFIKALYKNKRTFVANTVGGRIAHPRRVTDGINLMVQGSEADVYKLAVHKLVRKTKGEALKYFIFPLHDAMYLDVPEYLSKEYAELVKASMEEAWFELLQSDYFKYHDVPMDVEVKISDRLMS
jgi:DNA polymerase-1